MFFYELHEGDNELYSDILLAREAEMDPDVFFETVQAVRRRIQDTYETDTLIEAIAQELEQDHGFIYISDDRLTAAVNVSTDEAENFLSDLSGGEELEIAGDGAYRTMLAEFRGDDERRRPH